MDNEGRAVFLKRNKLQGVSCKTKRWQYKASKRRHFFVKHVGNMRDSNAMGSLGCRMSTDVPKSIERILAMGRQSY